MALTIAERIHALDCHTSDRESAAQNWQRWAQAPWFADGVAPWLHERGFDIHDFRSALGLLDNDHALDVSHFLSESPHAIGLRNVGGLARLLAPIADTFASQLWQRAAEDGILDEPLLGIASPESPIRRVLHEELLGRLQRIAASVLVLEVNVARMRGELGDDTDPAEGARRFVDSLLAGRAGDLCAEYQVMWRLCQSEGRRWQDATAALLARLREFVHAGTELLPEPATVEAISAAVGDPHRGGHTVRSISFGNGVKVVYKPRPLSGDHWYQELVEWVSALPDCPGLHAPRTVDYGQWGFQEWVDGRRCLSSEERSAFYERFGWLLGIAYVFSFGDLHMENLVASGPHPIPVDGETVGQPTLLYRREDGDESSEPPLLQRLATGSGLLPSALTRWYMGFDVSAFSGGLQARSTQEVKGFHDMSGSDAAISHRTGFVQGSRNRPDQGADPESTGLIPADYLDTVLAGFDACYRALEAHKTMLLAADGPLTALADVETRYVPRSTKKYAETLQESLHANLLRDSAERELYISHLWSEGRTNPELRVLCRSEVQDLLDLDIPVFTVDQVSGDIVDSRGRRIRSPHDRSPLDELRQHVATLGDEDRERQLWCIEAAIRGDLPRPRTEHRGQARPAGEDPAAIATSILDTLAAEALWGSSRRPTWLTLISGEGRLCAPGLAADDLYAGRIGIGLVLLYGGRLLNLPDHAALGEAVFASARQIAHPEATGARSLCPIGAWDGLAGVAYGLACAGHVLSDPDHVRAAGDLLGHISTRLDELTNADVTSGLAGVLLIAAELSRMVDEDRCHAVVRGCAERISALAETDDQGGARWASESNDGINLTGFSHGNSGIAAALCTAADVLGEPSYRALARRALSWEYAQFDTSSGDWPDYRRFDHVPEEQRSGRGALAWCHGAPGIALATSFCHPEPLPDWIVGHAAAAIEDRGDTLGVGLCHGLAGNLDILRGLDDGAYTTAYERGMQRLIGYVRDGHLDCGHFLGMYVPGLMNGISGVGYVMLRHLDPSAMPDVLGMRLPESAASR